MTAPVIFILGPLFVLVQGAAIFLTAFFAFRFRDASGALAKVGYMAVSYMAWITFTYAAFFLGADVWIVFGALMVSSLFSSVCFCVGWVVLPALKSKRNV